MSKLPPRLLLGLTPLALAALFAPWLAAGQDAPAEPPAAPAVEVAPAPAPDPLVAVAPNLRKLALELDDETLEALADGDWATARTRLAAWDPLEAPAGQAGTVAFLRAWAATHTGHPAEAEPWLPLLAKPAPSVPDAYRHLVRGEVLRAVDEPLAALAALAEVDPDTAVWPRAEIERAEVLKELDRTKEAWALLEALVERPDPAAGNPEALLLLAARHGVGSDEAAVLARRLWWAYPKTDHSRAAVPYLEGREPTWQEVALRAEVLMGQGDYRSAVAESGAVLAQATEGSEDACRLYYARARSYYRLNQLSNTTGAAGDWGPRCAAVKSAYGAKILFLKGRSEFRRGLYSQSAVTMNSIATLFPEETLADDGLTHAGIALQEAEQLEAARVPWEKALSEFAGGDLVPEAAFRLAFARYLDGDAAGAREAALALGALPLESDWDYVLAGRYWAARWLAYPDVGAPTRQADEAQVKKAIAEWVALCEQHPHSFYALQAHSRLRELAPEEAARLAKRPEDRTIAQVPWQVRLSFLEDPHVRSGVDLMRLGLVGEAKAEWSHVDDAAWSGDEKAWTIELRWAAGDWLFAHDNLRDWIEVHPPSTLGPREPQILRLAYPDKYWDIVQEVAKDYSYDPRLFHGLVREESNFNKSIVSHAGAMGLSQLMWPTAQQVAGWFDRKVTRAQLNDPRTNLTFGSRYLDAMHKQHGGSPYLALASYNAGSSRISRWAEEWGNPPTDHFVESIPYRETRGYVKRVMGTWHTLRWQFDDGDAFYDLSKFNHVARPNQEG